VRGKRDLLRIVRTPSGAVQADPTGKLAGRGAYLCRDETCLAQAVKQKKLGRALGVMVDPNIADQIKTLIRETEKPEAEERQGQQ
jgi:hypothetical protein